MQVLVTTPFRRNVTKHNFSSSLVPGHYYCIGNINRKTNDGKFDSIDRSDETQVRAAQSPLDLNITSFTQCNNSPDPPTALDFTTKRAFELHFGGKSPLSSTTSDEFKKFGVMCGQVCRRSDLWCRNDISARCNTGSGNIATNDSSLCQHPRVWADASCTRYWKNGEVGLYGFRCKGKNMRCVWPWYTLAHGELYSSEYTVANCPDKSDQVFNSSLTCSEHFQIHVKFHTKKFCNVKYPKIQSKVVCTNKTQWLSEKDSSYSDPHFCQLSCSLPGPSCQACSNSSYFQCSKSGQCVHPDLVCDGHPQCKEGEDEDLSMCHDEFIEMKIVQPLAKLKCKSLFYENMYIYATPETFKGLNKNFDHMDFF